MPLPGRGPVRMDSDKPAPPVLPLAGPDCEEAPSGLPVPSDTLLANE